MSQMPTFLRAYRQALRDVQRAVLVRGQTMGGPVSSSLAVFVAADRLSVPLARLRKFGAGSLDETVRESMPAASTRRAEFVLGYLAGYDKAVDVVADWGTRMVNPGARDALSEIVERLQQLRSRMTSQEEEEIETLRSRKFRM